MPRERTDKQVFAALVSAVGGQFKDLEATEVFTLPVLTTTERNALTAAEGMAIVNSTDTKLQVYVGGAWTNMH